MRQRLIVKQNYQKLISTLEPSDNQQQRIRTSRETFNPALANDYRITLSTQKQPSILTGSYARNTIIRPIDGIDLNARVHFSEHAMNKPPLSILRLMAAPTRNLYHRNIKVNAESQCVVVSTKRSECDVKRQRVTFYKIGL